MKRALVAMAAALACVAAAPAQAEVRTGQTGAGTLQPADPDVRIVKATVSYDTSGRLQGAVTAAGRLEGKQVNVVFYAGRYTKARACKGTAQQPFGAIGGIAGTFQFPPVHDPTSFVPANIRLAQLGDQVLGEAGVLGTASGATASLTGDVPLFANRPWDCAWVTLQDSALATSRDRTRDFPLGREAIARNRQLQRRAVARCKARPTAKGRAACRAKARERYAA